MPFVARIDVYPTKSFDPVAKSIVEVLPTGALKHDRQFALVDSAGKFINAKRTALIHLVKFIVDVDRREFQLARRDGTDEWSGHLDVDGQRLSDWFSRYFSLDVSIIENDVNGFPDDLDSPGPTIVSTATLQTVADWFPELTLEEVRRRIRANLEIGDAEPFWEDRLFRSDKIPQLFRIGSVVFGGVNPCRRCVVPSRHPLTGTVAPHEFAKQFDRRRRETLPPWSPKDRFDHFYRLTTNTRLSELNHGTIKVGEKVKILNLD